MATIVDIRSAVPGRFNRPHNVPAKGSAEILIFTGVRYSRWADNRSEVSQLPACRVRDRLDLDQ